MSRKSPLRGLERNGIARKNVFLRSSECFSLSFNGFERVSKSCFFRLMLPSKISSIFLFCKKVRNGIPRFFTFCGMARYRMPSVSVPRNRRNSDGINQNFRLFCVPRNNFFLGIWPPYSRACLLILTKAISPD
jgi:hypothetical protein